jgi:hypothetical protein
MPLTSPSFGGASALVLVHAKVVRGRVGIAVVNKTGTAVITEHYYEAGPSAADYVVVIPTPPDAGQLVFRSDRNEPSEIVIEKVEAFRLT